MPAANQLIYGIKIGENSSFDACFCAFDRNCQIHQADFDEFWRDLSERRVVISHQRYDELRQKANENCAAEAFCRPYSQWFYVYVVFERLKHFLNRVFHPINLECLLKCQFLTRNEAEKTLSTRDGGCPDELFGLRICQF